MTKPTYWTVLDETTLLFARTIEWQLRQSHGMLFAAAFLDEFASQIEKLAMQTLLADLSEISGPRG